MASAATRPDGRWEIGPGPVASRLALPAALALAFVLHLALLLVSFEPPDNEPAKRTTRPLEVVVLRRPAPTDERPDRADALAQVDRVGSGEKAAPEPDEPIAVEPPPPEPEVSEAIPEPPPPALPPTPTPAEPPEPPPTLTARLEPSPAEPEPLPEPLPEPAPIEPPPVSAAEILASRDLEIARLTARLDQTTGESRRPRRKAISASTREYKYASYLEAWRRKVERIGNLNYPDEAKQRRLYGSLILHVAVRADGSLEEVRVLRSSGFDVLDQAAKRIVELAAPYAPFPPDIREETDVLDITRTWQFLSSNRLGWEN
jgi:periplasmic protein TonB